MPFVTLTPNLAIDRTLELSDSLVPETLHRVRRVWEVAGGKGVNVARMLRILGAEVKVAGFLGGSNGQKFLQLLEQEGLTGIFQDVAGETRECHILLDGRTHPTEVYEPGPAVTSASWRALVEKLPGGQLIVSGSLPSGLEPEDFRELLQELPRRPVVDSSGEALRAALEAGVALVKPNRAELQALLPVQGDGVAEAKLLYETHGTPVLLSLGKRGAAYVAEDTVLIPAAEVDVVNPVASGDCLLAAFIWARAENWSVSEALCLGVAAGTQNAVSGGGARILRSDVITRFEIMRESQSDF